MGRQLYCLNCGAEQLEKLPNNTPVGDFACRSCAEQYELKSKAGRLAKSVPDGAYKTMLERLSSVIQERKPLAVTARRAGWVGCNIIVDRIPQAGKVTVVKHGVLLAREQVLRSWQRTCFLRHEGAAARGWLVEVMKCVEEIGRIEFDISDIYAFEPRLQLLYPGNSHVREKMRQQLQVLRDASFIEFLGRGRYRRKPPA